MNSEYRYQGGTSQSRGFEPLPEGDYVFSVVNAGEPYFKNEKWIVEIDLEIEGGARVRYWPWSGTTLTGDKRDGIGDFLAGIDRAPKIGQPVNWAKLKGARGRCRLKIETSTRGKLEGKEVNVVAWIYRPNPLDDPKNRPQPAKPLEPEREDDLDMGTRESDEGIPF